MTGRDPFRISRLEVEKVDLEERIALLPLALEDHFAPVRTEIALARPLPGEGYLPGRGEEAAFLRCRFIRLGRQDEGHGEGNLEGICSHSVHS